MSKKDFTFQKLHISGHLSTLGPKLAQPRLPLSPRLNQQLKGELANIMIIIVKWAQSQNVQSPTVVVFSFFQLSVRVNNPWNQGSRNPRAHPSSGWSQTKFPKQPTFSLCQRWTLDLQWKASSDLCVNATPWLRWFSTSRTWSPLPSTWRTWGCQGNQLGWSGLLASSCADSSRGGRCTRAAPLSSRTCPSWGSSRTSSSSPSRRQTRGLQGLHKSIKTQNHTTPKTTLLSSLKTPSIQITSTGINSHHFCTLQVHDGGNGVCVRGSWGGLWSSPEGRDGTQVPARSTGV